VEGRNAIQREVDKIRDNPAAHRLMVQRAATFFPYVNEAFNKIGVPLDLTYICILESGLRGDAISKSKAVGFWQFKESTAKMVGLTINDKVDERKHIFRASIGAARYFATNYFRHGNWLYSVISYYEGGTGALNHIDLDQANATTMTIDENLHIYAQKAIAHKIAYEDEIKAAFPPKVWLEPFMARGSTDLARMLENAGIDEETFRKYNLWMKGNLLPPDGDYSYFVPRSGVKYVHIPDPLLHLYAQEVFPPKKETPTPTAEIKAKTPPSESNVYRPKPAPVTTVTKRSETVTFEAENEPEAVSKPEVKTIAPPDTEEIVVKETFKEKNQPQTVDNGGIHPVYKWKTKPAEPQKQVKTESETLKPTQADEGNTTTVMVNGRPMKVVPTDKPKPVQEKVVTPQEEKGNVKTVMINGRPVKIATKPADQPQSETEKTTQPDENTEEAGIKTVMINGRPVKIATKPTEKPNYASHTPKLKPQSVHPSQGYVRPNYATKAVVKEEFPVVTPKEEERPLTPEELEVARAEAEAQGKVYYEKKHFVRKLITEDVYHNNEFVYLTPTFGIVDVSSKFNIPVRTLCQFNGLRAGQLPRPGTILYLFAPVHRNIYIPTEDDLPVEEIAMRHGKDPDFLREINNMKPTERFVKKGQKFYIREPKPDYEPWTIFDFPETESMTVNTTPAQQEITPKETASVPETPTKTMNYLTHTVEAFESLESIAEKYETTVEIIKDLNKMYRDELKIGEVLRVKVLE
jgi:LysM repeat protein